MKRDEIDFDWACTSHSFVMSLQTFLSCKAYVSNANVGIMNIIKNTEGEPTKTVEALWKKKYIYNYI